MMSTTKFQKNLLEFQEHYFADSGEVDNPSDHISPVEFLNTLSQNFIPPHNLLLTVRMPVILLRNLSTYQGLYNGTPMCVEQLHQWEIEAEILNGTHIGEKALNPRVNLLLT